MKLLSLCTMMAILLAASICDAASEEARRVNGCGPTYRAAVMDAIVTAIDQHYGTMIASSIRTEMESSHLYETSSEHGRKNNSHLKDELASSMQKNSKGRISGYSVLNEVFDENEDCYRVELEVRFPAKYVPPGRAPDALRRMVVTTFNVRNRNFAWHGQTVDSVEWAVALGNALNVDLTQTRKFTMLDRAYDQEINAELARLTAANASPEDAVRLNQKLATDYLVVGEIELGDVLAPKVNPMTWQTMASGPALFATVNYRVLLAPTGQLKWSDTIRVDSSQFPCADVKSFVAVTSEMAAALVCKGIMENILPLEVVNVSAGLLVIGEGGRQVAAGQRFSVNVLGDEVCDTRTGEVIDAVEVPVAVCEIVSVQPKLSYARLVSGKLEDVAVGARLRPLPDVAPPVAEPVGAPMIKVNANGGVVIPF